MSLEHVVARFNGENRLHDVLGVPLTEQPKGGVWRGGCPLCGGGSRLWVRRPADGGAILATCGGDGGSGCKANPSPGSPSGRRVGDALKWAMWTSGRDPAQRGETARFLRERGYSLDGSGAPVPAAPTKQRPKAKPSDPYFEGPRPTPCRLPAVLSSFPVVAPSLPAPAEPLAPQGPAVVSAVFDVFRDALEESTRTARRDALALMEWALESRRAREAAPEVIEALEEEFSTAAAGTAWSRWGRRWGLANEARAAVEGVTCG